MDVTAPDAALVGPGPLPVPAPVPVVDDLPATGDESIPPVAVPVKCFLWEQQPKEPESAYLAFVGFRHLEPEERSLRLAAERTGHPLSKISSWAGRFDWTTRAKAWDRTEDQRLIVQTRKQLKALIQEELLQCNVMRSEIVSKWLIEAGPLERKQLKGTDIAKILVGVGRYQHFLLGAPESTVRQELTGPEGGPIQTEQINVIETIVRTREDVAQVKKNPKGEFLMDDMP